MREYRRTHPHIIKPIKRREYLKHKSKFNAKSRKYYADHKDKCTVKNRERYLKNREVRLLYRKQYLKDNTEQVSKHGAEYYQKNTDKIKKRVTKYNKTPKGNLVDRLKKIRRDRLKKSTDDWTVTPEAILQLLEKQQYKCAICKWELEKDIKWNYLYHIDHIMPLSKQGPHSITNIQLAHWKCNMEKSDKIYILNGCQDDC